MPGGMHCMSAKFLPLTAAIHVQEAVEQAPRTPLGVLHSVLTEIARRFVLLEVKCYDAQLVF